MVSSPGEQARSMPNLPEPNGNDPLKRTPTTSEGASLIHMAASEQQQPGALGRCPVCGTPYVLGAEPVTPPLPESASIESTESSEQRVVLLCPQCGTYSVGAPPTA